ncbi:MAG: recombinase family protein [Candidatus Margulisbacteria bacterium]|nr:recombinase family protein [Candidatus Margulisiibacteriota bacterium]
MEKVDVKKLISEYKRQSLSDRLPKKLTCGVCGKEFDYGQVECPGCGKRFKRVGFWNRISHEESVERDAPQSHFKLASDYCKFNNWVIVKEYPLLEVQGKYIRDEAEYHKYRYDVENHNIDILLLTELKRLARKTSILIEEADYMRKLGVDIVAINQKIDTTSAYGKFFYVLMAALAELESDETSYRIKRNVPNRARSLKVLGNKAAYGWDWVELNKYNKDDLLTLGYSKEIIDG